MRKMDSIGLKICSFQATLFAESMLQTDCSSKIFIRRFMNSDFARRVDLAGFLVESNDSQNVFIEIDEQYGKSFYGREKFSMEELRWMGYIYRYWSYVTEKPSKQIYKIAKPEYLRTVYYPYHSLDPMQAIERIQEDMGQSKRTEITDIGYGVDVLRRIRKKYESNNQQQIHN